MEKNEEMYSPLGSQADGKGKENSLKRKQGTPKHCESNSFSIPPIKKQLLLESTENVLSPKPAQTGGENGLANFNSDTYHLKPQREIEKINCSLLSKTNFPRMCDKSSSASPHHPLSIPSASSHVEENTTVSQQSADIGMEINADFEKSANKLEKRICPSIDDQSNMEDILHFEDEQVKDNLKLEKEKIKRRRSSFGRCLSHNLTSEMTDISGTKTNAGLGNVGSSSNLCTGTTASENVVADHYETSHQERENPLFMKYDELSRKLTNEYHAWKKLRRSRKEAIFEVQRELSEAKKKETLIEPDHILPHLNNEKKAILLSRPDYANYLQEVKFGMERLVLTQHNVERISHIYNWFVQESKVISRSYYEIIEEEILGELRGKDLKVLLKSLMNCEKTRS